MKARAEIPHREWVEFEVTLSGDKKIQSMVWRAWGCHSLLAMAQKASKSFSEKKIEDLKWEGVEHWNLLISEAFDRLKGSFKIPVEDPETCHCRKVPTVKVDEAIVLGAHSPEKVRAWTTASSGCGTCRPVVEKLIAYRLKKAA